MPEKRTASKTTAKRPAAERKTTTRKVAAKTVKAAPPEVRSSGSVCPRCGTATFAPEQRTRVDGNRTVRYSILVCERGHTFAKPVSR